MVAEVEGRQWLAFEEELEYLAASAFRFLPPGVSTEVLERVHHQALAGEQVDLTQVVPQPELFTE
jgi:site-specific DNA-methyltransferase (cytosine-N4-specific)